MIINDELKLIDSFQSSAPVRGLTHTFYKYPARFAPEFAREFICQFSKEGDCICDAFMGGGTAIVEAVASGRYAVGMDINPLAHFITASKTTPLSLRDQDNILFWAESVDFKAAIDNIDDYRTKNLPDEMKRIFAYAMATVNDLEYPRQRRFAKCVLLKLGQWAIDYKKNIPTTIALKIQFMKQVNEMLEGLNEFVVTAKSNGISKNKITSRRVLYLGNVHSILQSKEFPVNYPKPKLILTSPPYPGVHVVYHRWQIRGRRETPAPYWITDLRDGHGESYFTLGSRSEKGLRDYFENIENIFRNMRVLIDPEAIVVQLVAFSEPGTQLPAFLNAMTNAGYEEITPLGNTASERPLRKVPNRKWYANSQEKQPASNEILLVHKPVQAA